MKGQPQLDRTKVVVRHLPPSISKSALLDPIDSLFSGRYSWVSFRPGKISQKHSFSRAYLDFKRPEDVIEFAEFFEGHVFVNEKGIQFKTTVEYAPSQRVPNQWSKKDGREGTINKDPEYLEFLEFLAKPAENLPSAEIQLERREAEKAVLGAVKEIPIVTPLMDFVRQKRAAKGGSRRSFSSGKLSRKGVGPSAGGVYSALPKRGTDRRRNSTKMYVLKDAMKNSTVKDKSKYIRVAKRDTLSSTAGVEVLDESGKKKVLLLKGNEREISQHQNTTSTKTIVGSSSLEQNQRCKSSSGRIIKNIQYHSSPVHSDMQIQGRNMDKDKRNFRRQHGQLILKDTNGSPDCKVIGSDMHGSCCEKKEKCTRNKYKPERGVWAPRLRPDGSFAKDESLPATTQLDTLEGGIPGDIKVETTNARNVEVKIIGSGFSSPSSLDNGFHKHLARRRSTNNVKDTDGSSVISEGRNLKRGGPSGCGSHEKQVWVQKSSSGS